MASGRAKDFNLENQTSQEMQSRGLSQQQRQQEGSAAEEKGLSAFSVRLPMSQKKALERWLWDKKGEKLAAGARRILTEYMNREGIR